MYNSIIKITAIIFVDKYIQIAYYNNTIMMYFPKSRDFPYLKRQMFTKTIFLISLDLESSYFQNLINNSLNDKEIIGYILTFIFH